MVGETVSHYRLVERLGSGGLGAVYRAEDLQRGRTVALKFLPAGDSQIKATIDHLRHGAHEAASLDHPNICSIYGIDETADGAVLIAMALCEGQPLSQRLAHGPLPVEEAMNIAAQIGEGLAVAHERGIVHRDIKPSNVMVSSEGSVKIVDFGLARNRAATPVSDTSVIVGTPAYLSPEQIQGEPIDGRADLWSLGVMLYEMLAGRPPYAGATPAAVIRAILCERPAPLNVLRPDLPRRVVGVIDRLLARQMRSRYASAAELLRDLRMLRKAQ